jgi:hypothetical protein
VNVGAIEPIGVGVLVLVAVFAAMAFWPIGRGK